MAATKTVNGLALASCKTFNGLAAASVKSRNGLDAVAGSGLPSPVGPAATVTGPTTDPHPASTYSGQTRTLDQKFQYLWDAGFNTASDLQIGAAIAIAESSSDIGCRNWHGGGTSPAASFGYRTENINTMTFLITVPAGAKWTDGSSITHVMRSDRGMWQISDHYYPQYTDAQCDDPATAARIVKLIHDAFGWSQWDTYNSGAYTGLVSIDDAQAFVDAHTATFVFSDEFAGSSLDTTKWYVANSAANFGGVSNSAPSSANVAVTGGNLRLRITRSGGGFRGALIATIDYENGFAPYYPNFWKAEWQVPYQVDVRAQMPPVAGAWPAAWIRGDSGVDELDFCEQRMTFPTDAEAHQHHWVGGSDTNPQDFNATVTNMGTNFHVYTAIVRSTGVTYKVDSTTLGTGAGIANGTYHAIVLNAMIGDVGSFGAGGSQPPGGDPGPWDMLVDYVRVTAL